MISKKEYNSILTDIKYSEKAFTVYYNNCVQIDLQMIGMMNLLSDFYVISQEEYKEIEKLHEQAYLATNLFNKKISDIIYSENLKAFNNEEDI